MEKGETVFTQNFERSVKQRLYAQINIQYRIPAFAVRQVQYPILIENHTLFPQFFLYKV